MSLKRPELVGSEGTDLLLGCVYICLHYTQESIPVGCLPPAGWLYPPFGHTHPPPERTWDQRYPAPRKGHGTRDTLHPLPWTDKHLWKHYLPATSLACVKNYFTKLSDRYSSCAKERWYSFNGKHYKKTCAKKKTLENRDIRESQHDSIVGTNCILL